MVNCRRSTNTEHRRNRISVDKLLLVIVTVFASVAVHVDSSETDWNEVDCTLSKTCKTCADRVECSWSLVQQTCAASKRIQGGFIVNNKDQCTQFTVAKRWAVANVFNQIAVKISNDTSGFASYLRKTKIACHLEGLELKGSLVNDERIVCEQLRVAPSNFAKNAKALLQDFYVTFDKRRLRFDDDADYYFNVYARDCGGVRAAGDDCVTCLWTDADNRYYLSKCSARDPCTGSYEAYDARDADSGTRISSAAEQDVRVECANATIRSFEPRYGLRAGGTAMKIAVRGHGILAENATAVAVTVAGRDCTAAETLPSADDDGVQTITCVTAAAPTAVVNNGTGGDAGPVRVTYVQRASRRFTVESAETFGFVEPRVTAASPTCGPVAGGTLLNLTGEYLDASAVRVRVTPRDAASADDATTCELIAADRDRILCVTGASRGGPADGSIELLFESGYRVRSETFVYAGDPALDPSQTFDGIASGGTAVPVRGNHFSCIKSAAFCVDADGARHCAHRRCRVHNDTYMSCLSPELRPAAAAAAVRSLRFGLRMDFADHQLDLCPQSDRAAYDVYPDPVYDDFVVSDDRRYVVINGRDSGWNCRADDVTVRILRNHQHLQHDEPSVADCAVVRTDRNRIVCEIDAATWPYAVAAGGGRNDEVVLRVTVGDALAYLVREKSTGNDRDGSSTESSTANPALVAYGTVVVPGLLVFFVIVIVVAVFRCKRKNRNDDASQQYNVRGGAGGGGGFPGTIAELQLLQTGKSAEMI